MRWSRVLLLYRLRSGTWSMGSSACTYSTYETEAEAAKPSCSQRGFGAMLKLLINLKMHWYTLTTSQHCGSDSNHHTTHYRIIR